MSSVSPLDLTGHRYGRLTVLSEALTEYWGVRKRAVRMFNCECDCGAFKTVSHGALRSGGTSSCGCLRRENASAKAIHGYAAQGQTNSTYTAWCSLRRRSLCKTHRQYPDYGGRGITVCERWNYFENFLEDMGERPSEKHSIDRYPDNDGPYSPENCRWATDVEQCRNKRSNRILSHNGEDLCITEWAERTGMHRTTISGRLEAGFSVEEALAMPLKRKRKASL